MFLGAITSKGNLKLEVVKNKYKSKDYLKDLEDTFIPWCKSQFEDSEWIFQQDNSRVHTASVVRRYFSKNKIKVLEWPACSPDINIIENIWSIISSKMYQKWKHYTKESLIKEVQEAANKISKETIINLYNSIPKRLNDIIDQNREEINY